MVRFALVLLVAAALFLAAGPASHACDVGAVCGQSYVAPVQAVVAAPVQVQAYAAVPLLQTYVAPVQAQAVVHRHAYAAQAAAVRVVPRLSRPRLLAGRQVARSRSVVRGAAAASAVVGY